MVLASYTAEQAQEKTEQAKKLILARQLEILQQKIDNSIKAAIQNGKFHTRIVLHNTMNQQEFKIITEPFTSVGYTCQLVNGDRDILIKW